MEFLVLGPLTVRDDAGATVALRAPRSAALLALFLTRRGDVLPPEEIAETLWPGLPTSKQSSALRFHIWRLRNALEPGRPRRSRGAVVIRESSGYRLELTGHRLDILEFEAELVAAHDALFAEPARAFGHVRTGLSLWRGAPFGDVLYEDFAQGEINRARAMHLDFLLLEIDCLLRLDRAGEAVIELEGLTTTHPLVDRLWCQLMAGLSFEGRHSEAHLAYRRAVRALAGDGLEPSDLLRSMEAHLHARLPSRTVMLDLLATPRRHRTAST